MSAVVWIIIGAVVGGLLLIAWLMDRSARGRGSATVNSADISAATRDSRRDAHVIGSAGALLPQDSSWTSWSRRNR